MTTPAIVHRAQWTSISPDSDEWKYIHFRTVTLAAGQQLEFASDAHEKVFVPLEGRFTASSDGAEYAFGRSGGVFASRGGALVIGRGASVTLTAHGRSIVAVASAAAEQSRRNFLIQPEDVPIEVRGAGDATRQISTVLGPADDADRLMVVEVWIPGGNWSGYPPHRHDRDGPDEVTLEELYYYRTRDSEAGWGLQRCYSPEREFDVASPVFDGDVCTIPWGYHTTVAPPGQDLYLLCILAGQRRELRNTIDPDLVHIHHQWEHSRQDPRVPMVTVPAS